ncbi:protein of unknown function [Nitrospira japonica]|uniref:Uncharacterized protein n=1 Tax=Nitrospira japonica TaxID=1325564 RepID=A0A1W1I8S4_9BACT|nr:protein of unknown function [Nitrospira japonica]
MANFPGVNVFPPSTVNLQSLPFDMQFVVIAQVSSFALPLEAVQEHLQWVVLNSGGSATLTAAVPTSMVRPRVPTTNTFTIALIALLLVILGSIAVDTRLSL